MPNIGAMLKQEITRLARREVRVQVQATKKASTQYRRHIAALRRQVTALEQQLATLRRRGTASGPPPNGGEPSKIRFVAKGLKSQRARLGLSAADFGRLVGVSAQSIYNWEGGQTRPRDEQVARLAQLRSIGKREAGQRLAQTAKRAPAKRRP